jgi:hypothetical protein
MCLNLEKQELGVVGVPGVALTPGLVLALSKLEPCNLRYLYFQVLAVLYFWDAPPYPSNTVGILLWAIAMFTRLHLRQVARHQNNYTTLYTPNLGLPDAVLVLEKEQVRFNHAREGAGGRGGRVRPSVVSAKGAA